MGDIAEMHIEAFEAGLDPNEMDGADWADFYSERDEPASLAVTISCLGGDCRTMLCWIDDLQMHDAEPEQEFDSSTAARAAALHRYVPDFSEADAATLIDLVVKLNALAEEDRLDDEPETSK